jgi:hypothetical protein
MTFRKRIARGEKLFSLVNPLQNGVQNWIPAPVQARGRLAGIILDSGFRRNDGRSIAESDRNSVDSYKEP